MRTHNSSVIAAAMVAAVSVCVVACDKKAASGGGGSTAPVDTNAALVYTSVHAALGKPLLEAVGEGTKGDAMLAAHAADVERLVEATNSADCDFGVNYAQGMDVLLPHLGTTRALARVLRADASRLLAAGDPDGAAKRTAAIFRLAVQVTKRAQTVIELLVGAAIAHLGAELVYSNAALSRAAWKTDIQRAILEVEASGTLRSGAIVHAEGQMLLKSLHDGTMIDMSANGGRNWKAVSQSERDEAAKTLTPILAEMDRAWASSDGPGQLDAIVEKAKPGGVGDLLPALGHVRKSVTDLKAELKKASAALSK